MAIVSDRVPPSRGVGGSFPRGAYVPLILPGEFIVWLTYRYRLTPRECDFVCCAASLMDGSHAALALGLTLNTIRRMQTRLLAKLGVRDGHLGLLRWLAVAVLEWEGGGGASGQFRLRNLPTPAGFVGPLLPVEDRQAVTDGLANLPRAGEFWGAAARVRVRLIEGGDSYPSHDEVCSNATGVWITIVETHLATRGTPPNSFGGSCNTRGWCRPRAVLIDDQQQGLVPEDSPAQTVVPGADGRGAPLRQ
jgi:hypothetical protein